MAGNRFMNGLLCVKLTASGPLPSGPADRPSWAEFGSFAVFFKRLLISAHFFDPAAAALNLEF